MTTVNSGEASQSSDRSGHAWVYGPLAANAISGTIDFRVRGRANTFTNIYHATVALWLAQPDGTLRSTLLNATTLDQGTVWTASYANYTLLAGTITTQTPTAGDYLIMEVGTVADFLDVDSFDIQIGDTSASDHMYVDFNSATISLQGPTAVTYTNDGQTKKIGETLTNMVASVTPSGVQSSCTFTVQTGTLPAGVSLNATTGTISGSPSVNGTYTFTIRATNGGGTADTGTLTITVRPTGGGFSMNIKI